MNVERERGGGSRVWISFGRGWRSGILLIRRMIDSSFCSFCPSRVRNEPSEQIEVGSSRSLKVEITRRASRVGRGSGPAGAEIETQRNRQKKGEFRRESMKAPSPVRSLAI